MLTLDAFKATATRMSIAEAEHCLGTHLTETAAVAAWVYAGSAYLEEMPDGTFHLVIDRSEYSHAERDVLAWILYRDYWLDEQGWNTDPASAGASDPEPDPGPDPGRDAVPLLKACKTCASDRVFVDANAEWDHANQMWTLGDFCDDRQAWCLDCDGPTTIVDLPG